MPIAEQQGTFPSITPQDLQDPQLFQLNYALQFLSKAVAALQGGAGPITVGNSFTATDLFAEDDAVPTNDLQLLTLGAALELFGTSKQLSANELSQNPTIPTSGGGSAGPSILVKEIALSSSSTTNIVPPGISEGSLLMIVLTCDGTAGDQITWDATMKNTNPNDIGNGANQLNFYLFLGRSDGNWWKIATQLGVTP